MKIIDKIKNWFETKEIIQHTEPKTIQTLNIFDDVWVLKEKQIHKGWVYEKTKNSIVVIYDGLAEIKFHYTRPLSQTIIVNGTSKLILNESDIDIVQTFENNTNS